MDYYYVYYPYGNATRYKHATKEAAIAEAKRLAGEQPARRFEILHCIGFVEAEKPKSVFISLEAEAIQGVVTSEVLDNLLEKFPAPPVPTGYSRWVYRGMGWRQDGVLFSYLEFGDKGWSNPVYGNTVGASTTRYLEAVK